MKQYLDLLRAIKEKGTRKSAARTNMPCTTSLFGYQFRHNLADGFPLLTTKKLSFKNIAVELIWFLRGDTNIRYLVNNGCNIWNEDAYNYYVKLSKRDDMKLALTFSDFLKHIKEEENKFVNFLTLPKNYVLGDCGVQYGALWRSWGRKPFNLSEYISFTTENKALCSAKAKNEERYIDQIKELIENLKENPMGRRHIVTAWNPATLDQMALNACHAFVQFNCRPLTLLERCMIGSATPNNYIEGENAEQLDLTSVPKYYLDCQMYQRSGDAFLGVPYNIASYALFTSVIAQFCNMIPGEFIHTFGDVHIYENHEIQVNEQLAREPKALPTLQFTTWFETAVKAGKDIDWVLSQINDWKDLFYLENYNPGTPIKAELSTGLK